MSRYAIVRDDRKEIYGHVALNVPTAKTGENELNRLASSYRCRGWTVGRIVNADTGTRNLHVSKGPEAIVFYVAELA